MQNYDCPFFFAFKNIHQYIVFLIIEINPHIIQSSYNLIFSKN